MEFLSQYFEITVSVSTFIIIEAVKRWIIKEDVQRKLIPLLACLIGVGATLWHKQVIDLPTITVGLVSGGAGTWLYELKDNVVKLINTYSKVEVIEVAELTDGKGNEE